MSLLSNRTFDLVLVMQGGSATSREAGHITQFLISPLTPVLYFLTLNPSPYMIGRNSVVPWLQQRRLTIDLTVKERNPMANGEVGKSTFERTVCLDARHEAGHLEHRTCENDAENASALIYHGDQF